MQPNFTPPDILVASEVLDYEKRDDRRLTQLWCLAKNKGVGPEFADGGAVEADVTHRLSEAVGCEDVHHVQSCPHRSYDAAEGIQNRQNH